MRPNHRRAYGDGVSTSSSQPNTRKWFVLAASSLAAFSATVMATSINVAIPSVVRAFDSEFAVVQWVVLSYLLANSTLLPIIGRVADMLGKKPLFVAGFVVFTLASLLCGISPSVGWLIGFRALQGVGAGLLLALGLAIVTDTFPSHERGKALGINGAILSAGIVVGPSLGGFLVDAFSWRWVFAIGVPVGIVGVLLALRYVPEGSSEGRQRFDLPGAATLFSCLLALLLALTLGQRRGFLSVEIVTLFALFAVLFGVFLRLEHRSPDPVVDLKLFRHPELSVGLASGLAAFIAIAGTIFLMPFYLENVLGYAPREVGLLMAVVPIVLVFVAPIAGSLSDRYGPRPVTVVGLALVFVGYLAIGTLDQDTTALGYILRFLPIGLGMGVFQSPNNSAIMGAVPRERSGVAGGLLSMTRSLGQTAGIAVLGTIWSVRVNARAQQDLGGEATAAPLAAQVGGLHDMLYVVQVMIFLALLLCVWTLVRDYRNRAPSPATDHVSP